MLRLISGLCLLLHVLPVLLAKGFIAFIDLPFSAESFAYSMNNVRDFHLLQMAMAGAKPDADHVLGHIGLGKILSWTCCQHWTECTSFEQTWLSILKLLMRWMINTSLWQNFIRSDKRQSETCSFIACKILLACVAS